MGCIVDRGNKHPHPGIVAVFLAIGPGIGDYCVLVVCCRWLESVRILHDGAINHEHDVVRTGGGDSEGLPVVGDDRLDGPAQVGLEALEDDVDEQGDVANVDLLVAIHVTDGVGVACHDEVEDDVNVMDVHLAVAVHVALDDVSLDGLDVVEVLPAIGCQVIGQRRSRDIECRVGVSIHGEHVLILHGGYGHGMGDDLGKSVTGRECVGGNLADALMNGQVGQRGTSLERFLANRRYRTGQDHAPQLLAAGKRIIVDRGNATGNDAIDQFLAVEVEVAPPQVKWRGVKCVKVDAAPGGQVVDKHMG